MLDDWTKFTQTGSVYDYLKYKQNEKDLKAENNADDYKGSCNKSTDYRGE